MTKAEFIRARMFMVSYGRNDATMHFGHWAPTLKQATADAKHWLKTGAMRVCIDRRLPSDNFKRVRCMRRR